jgi:hypothetical protein
MTGDQPNIQRLGLYIYRCQDWATPDKTLSLHSRRKIQPIRGKNKKVPETVFVLEGFSFGK